MNAATQVHFVTVTPPDSTDWQMEPTVKFECRGDETSPCHQYPDCSCESWDDDHPHPKITHSECWMESWFEAEGYSYDGEDRDDNSDYGIPADMNRSGPIKTSFEEEWISWEFEPTE